MIGQGIRLRASKSLKRGHPWSKTIAFGFSVASYSGNTPRVTVHNCRFQLGANAPVACADTTVSLSWATTHVYARYQHSNQALTIQANGSGPDWADTAYSFKLLMELTIVDGNIRRWIALHGMWIIPARVGN
jgi:hypothetical protein